MQRRRNTRRTGERYRRVIRKALLLADRQTDRQTYSKKEKNKRVISVSACDCCIRRQLNKKGCCEELMSETVPKTAYTRTSSKDPFPLHQRLPLFLFFFFKKKGKKRKKVHEG